MKLTIITTAVNDAVDKDNYIDYLRAYRSIEMMAEHYDMSYDDMFNSIQRGKELFQKEIK